MRILIISDVHGNIEALSAVEKAAGAVDGVLFLGDVTDYGPDPKACIAWIKEREWKRLRGNHDHAVLTKVDCQCGASFKPFSIATREYMWRILEEEHYEFIRATGPVDRFELDGKKVYAAHAAPSDPLFKYLRPSNPAKDFENEAGAAGDADVILLGHTHFPMDVVAGGARIVNPGSVGQPRDGDPRAGYAIWNDGEITLRRVEYDREKTVRAIEKCPLAPEVISRLSEVLKTGK